MVSLILLPAAEKTMQYKHPPFRKWKAFLSTADVAVQFAEV
jgi:hypothetical protein